MYLVTLLTAAGQTDRLHTHLVLFLAFRTNVCVPLVAVVTADSVCVDNTK